MITIPKLSKDLTKEHITFLHTFASSCRHTIISMLKQSQSGHPGGSLSSIDYLTLLYAYIISQSGEDVVISNGHISPAVYAVLAELGYVSKASAITTFRQLGSIFEGHITRKVPGVHYGTGPLGIGISAASGFAYAKKLQEKKEKVYALLGDGEANEGQVYEMMHTAAKYKLDNFIVFMDHNEVQLTDSTASIMPVDVKKTFKAAGWHVLEVDGHNFAKMWKVLREAHTCKGAPILIIGHTTMGRGIDYMEKEGKAKKATWHGNAPKPEEADIALSQVVLTKEQQQVLEKFRREKVKWKPKKPEETPLLKKLPVKTGRPKIYPKGTITDCRSAYGAALLDLAKKNKNIVALTADLMGSVKTADVAKIVPKQHIEVGIAEQQMISMAGGLSLSGFTPFASTFGAFMTSRAKDQARVNDINHTNVKMVATHSGLSVGEDGPTHQAIDDMNSMLGLLNTMIIEPADANQCDRIIRYIASHYGSFYIRMGRHKYPVILKENGQVYYDEKYTYTYGICDRIRSGTDITIVATGATVVEAIAARDMLREKHPKISVEIIAASSIKKFDKTLVTSLKKTQHVLTVEDHNTTSGLGSQLADFILEKGLPVKKFSKLGVREYQLSAPSDKLYSHVGIDKYGIMKGVLQLLSKQ